MERRAKIVATIGPRSDDPAILRRLIESGMNVARLNFSHGSHEEHATRIQRIREISQRLQKPIAILQDLQGPKLRVGKLPDKGIALSAGQRVILSSQKDISLSPDTIFVPMEVPNLEKSVEKGNRILLDDGNLELKVLAIKADSIETEVVLGGLLTSRKGVNLPGAHLDIPGFTEKDHADLVFGLQQEIDAIAISFVSQASDVDFVREEIRQFSPNKLNIPIIAKLERPEAIKNMEEIIQHADGVMVARGDLGVETSSAAVPIVQKEIIELANRYAKLVITATQMLDSMIHNPRPTRAEASDVANAVLDGTDAVMLSGETANGTYPVESVMTMADIITEAECHYERWGHYAEKEEVTDEDAVSITRAARALAHDRNVASIALFTITGKTALLMSKARPRVPIIAFTPNPQTYRRLGMYWGVTPLLVPFSSTVESMISYVETGIISHTSIQPGQQVVVVSGYPLGTPRTANLVLLHTMGQSISSFR